MSAKIATMTDAILAQMAAVTDWTEAFDAGRDYLERPLKSEAEKIRITALPMSTARQNISRGKRMLTHTIALGIRQNVNPESVEGVDVLVAFAESIADYWDSNSGGGRKLVSGTTGSVINVTHDPIYSPSELDTNRQFFSMVTLTVVEAVNL